ncbi:MULTISPECIES: family 20 glycosylhydrolase [unclassified Carboxylicivirga]|uniref:family 20 glycosylhydrolase n=1 Tax=Carboxylicivirga TaxID=1628153 RepID=UPI003D331A23
MRYLLPLLLGLLTTLAGRAHNHTPPLLPKPQVVEWQRGTLQFNALALECPESLKEGLSNDLIQMGFILDDADAAKLNVRIVEALDKVTLNEDEAYRLKVDNEGIAIDALTLTGVYRALQTLRQLSSDTDKNHALPYCSIVDWPAFRIRGFMHDVGRGFIPLDELKKQIDLLARFKINVFHWHLTEDIAWRLESRVFPQLTGYDNFERLPGKYYTLEEARELIDYCRQRHVLLIPEIDMPGHSAAFTRALGHDMQSPQGMDLLKQLMDEVCTVFAEVPYLHIGTDEVEFTNPDFVPEMVTYVRSKGKKVISWNPGWNYKKGEIDMIQMWSYRGRLHPGIPAIDSRLHYINHFDTFADLVALYNSNVAGVSQGNDDVAGAIIAAWNDRYVESTAQIVSENGLYPTMLTLAETCWQGRREKYFDEQGSLIDPDDPVAQANFADFEDRLLYYKEKVFADEPFAYVKQSNVNWRITDAFPNKGDLLRRFPPEEALQPTYQYEGKEYATRPAIGAGIYLRHVWGTLIPGFYTDPQPNHTAYAYTWVYSPVAREAGIYVRFQNYGRSEKDLPPPQGKWDYKESRIWLNDVGIAPPVWENTHGKKSNEISLQNENWEGRPPIPVQLKKGWNKLLLKMPVAQFSSDEVRLVKWMFNAVLVAPDGSKALDDIIYSPDKKRK